MGFFSWLTADTEESIACVYAERPTKTVYLLKPHGQDSLKEPAYEGDGKIDGVDVYEWLGKENNPVIGLSSSQYSSLGVLFSVGSYYEDDKALYFCQLHVQPVLEEPIRIMLGTDKPFVFFGIYSTPIDLCSGMSMNELIQDKKVTEKKFDVTYPLKFSFDPEATYKDLPASKDCPHQGYFY